MAKKFDIKTDRITAAINTGVSRRGQQDEVTPAEAAERAAQLKTQGRKGCKAQRINMAFTPDNYEFIKVMSRISGKTMTEFANYMLDVYRQEHGELFEQAKAIITQL